MRRIIVITFLLVWLIPQFAEAQQWRRFRRQIIGGVGVTNFLGDLGGADRVGRGGPFDLDLAATRPSLTVGFRYQINNFLFLRTNLNWGILQGSDEYTEEPARNGRNLSFRSGFLEVNTLAEFYIINNAKGNLYRLRGVKGRRGIRLGLDLYVFTGIGLMYFNPKAEYQGSYVALQPIGTEGQGLDGEKDKYNRFTMTIPYGIGIGKSLDRYWQVNFELTVRYTFTDYLDDVSGRYYGRDRLYQAKIDAGASQAEAQRAAYLSDPNIYDSMTDVQPDMEGEVRGDSSDNDTFLTGMITISRKIISRRSSRPKF